MKPTTSAALAAVLFSCGGIFMWRSGHFAAPPAAPPFAAAPPPVAAPVTAAANASPKVDIVFALDTTGSMSGMIAAAKAKIWGIARLAQQGQPTPELRVGLVAYRDKGDSYVTQRLDLTPDLDQVYARLTDLSAGGGGDGPEHVLAGLHDALDGEPWSTEASAVKLVYLVGDAPPHFDYTDGITLDGVLADARQKQVRITGIRCGTDEATLAAWTRIALPTDGDVASIDSSGGVHHVATPFDAELASLNAKLAATEVHYGSDGARAKEDEAVRRSLAADPEAQAERAAFFGAASGAAAAGSMDLVRASPTAVASARTEDLPDALRAMSPAEREAFVDGKRREREAIVAEVKSLSVKRDAWKTSSGVADAPGSFDSKVYESMKKAGGAKGMKF